MGAGDGCEEKKGGNHRNRIISDFLLNNLSTGERGSLTAICASKCRMRVYG